VAGADVPDAALEEARGHWERLRVPVPSLGRTPYVVTISDLLAFAASPQRYYAERVIGAEAPASRGLAAEADDPASGLDVDADAGASEARRADRWDEGSAVDDRGLDRRALGRAVHAVLGRVGPAGAASEAEVAEALRREWGTDVPSGAAAAARAMVDRFHDSPTGAALRAALSAGVDVRREVAFHARIRFPDGAEVAGLRALIVKGTIDLWLPTPEGVVLCDHKTNSATGPLGSVAAIREHYAWQMRLYALAVERILGRDVGGAALLLLDPGWQALHPTVELDVDVSGGALLDARRLCQAFARSALEDRYPARWEDLP
jgi:hypothetical protein